MKRGLVSGAAEKVETGDVVKRDGFVCQSSLSPKNGGGPVRRIAKVGGTIRGAIRTRKDSISIAAIRIEANARRKPSKDEMS